MKKVKHISMVFSAIFVFFMLSNSVSAENIIKYRTQGDIEKAMVKVVASKELSDTQKKSAIEKIMSESSKDALGNLIAEKVSKVKQALKNENMIVNANQKMTKKIDALSSITAEGKDESEGENGNPIPEHQGQLWKAYGNRMYTYTEKTILIPYVIEVTMKLINHYTVSTKGLTTRYLEYSRIAGMGTKVSNVSMRREDKRANKVGTDIDSKSTWDIELLPGTPIIGHVTEYTYFQKAYIKIVKWDKKKKKMYLNQHGKGWFA